MLTKLHYAADNEALFKACGGAMSTLVETREQIKSASSDAIPRSVIDAHRPAAGRFLIHTNIVGDEETYGPNRNGDSFLADDCRRCHDTFVTKGAYYREHKHRSKNLSIGTIKYSAFSEPMHRIELLIEGDIDKCQDIYESYKKGDKRSHSMSTKIAYDVCSCCGNKAAKSAEYCDHIKEHLNEWMPKFEKYAFMRNPNPQFFDASDVKKPADRTARYLQVILDSVSEAPSMVDEFQKAAASNELFVPSTLAAELEGVCLPGGDRQPVSTMILSMASTIQKLAKAEATVAAACRGKIEDAERRDYITSFVGAHDPDSWKFDPSWDKLQPGSFFYGLAKNAAVLPFPVWAKLITGWTEEQVNESPILKEACCAMPSLFNSLMESGLGCGSDAMSMFRGAGPSYASCDAGGADVVQKLLSEAVDQFGVRQQPTLGRITRVILKSGACKPAALPSDNVNLDTISGEARGFAELYALYKIAAVLDIDKFSAGEASELDLMRIVADQFATPNFVIASN